MRTDKTKRVMMMPVIVALATPPLLLCFVWLLQSLPSKPWSQKHLALLTCECSHGRSRPVEVKFEVSHTHGQLNGRLGGQMGGCELTSASLCQSHSVRSPHKGAAPRWGIP